MDELKAQLRNHIEAIQASHGITMPKAYLVRLRAQIAGARSPMDVACLLRRFERWRDVNQFD